MRSYTRHQLKRDAFAATTSDTISWAVENRSKLITGGVILGVILALLIGGWAWITYRDQQARAELAATIEKFNWPIRPPGTPASPDIPSFASAEERAKLNNADFARIAQKYPFTQSAAMAHYFAGVTAREIGDNAEAEKQLKAAADSHYKEIASLSKLALAGVYHDAHDTSQAIALYKDLAAHPTASVGKASAEFMLASLYEDTNQPDQARQIYQQLQKESPSTPVAGLAAQKLAALK